MSEATTPLCIACDGSVCDYALLCPQCKTKAWGKYVEIMTELAEEARKRDGQG